MSRSTVRSSLALALTAATALALSACSSGQVTQTATKVSSVQGVNVTVGDIAIRNAAIEFPASGDTWRQGESAHVTMVIVNTGIAPDKLIGATSSVATSVRTVAAAPSGSPTVEAQTSASAAPSAGPSKSAAPSKSAGPSKSAAPGASPSTGAEVNAGGAPIDLPQSVNGPVRLDNGGVGLVLENLTKEIRSGDLVTVTLRFERAGEVTLQLPLMTPLSPQPRGSAISNGEGPAEG